METWINGDTYEGDFVNGIKCGRGIYKWGATKSEYTGEFTADIMNGQGEMKWGDGREYRGTWKDGKRQGKNCEMSWPNGDK